MKETVLKFGGNVRVVFIRGYDTLRALNITVTRSLIFELLAATLQEEECTRIMAPILKKYSTNYKL